jgi:hypothetical protein
MIQFTLTFKRAIRNLLTIKNYKQMIILKNYWYHIQPGRGNHLEDIESNGASSPHFRPPNPIKMTKIKSVLSPSSFFLTFQKWNRFLSNAYFAGITNIVFSCCVDRKEASTCQMDLRVLLVVKFPEPQNFFGKQSISAFLAGILR